MSRWFDEPGERLIRLDPSKRAEIKVRIPHIHPGLFGLVLSAELALLADRGPGMISLSTPALRLKGSTHFVGIDGARKSQRHSAVSLHLHAKRHVVSVNLASQRRGTTLPLKRTAQLGAILLDLKLS